jgi:hypothetical protein
MRTIFLSLVSICLLLVSCRKENPGENQEDHVIVGGVYRSYTEQIINPCDIKVSINGENYNFNKLEASYNSHQPTTNQNILSVYLNDTIKNKSIHFEIFTPYMQPGEFFTKSDFTTDTIKIGWAGVREDFYDSEATFKWETVAFDKRKFTGKATFNIPKKITGRINPTTYYPEQKIEFEFD